MKKISFLFLLFIFFYLTTFSQSTVPQRVGWWKFDNPIDLTNSESGFGMPLTLVGSHISTKGPADENGAVQINSGSYYNMTHLISPKNGDKKVNEYTLQFDFKITENGSWRSFFQTDVSNSGDGDFFINPNGEIGVAAVGYSGFSITPNEWYRLIISVKNGTQFNVYLDGKLLTNGITQTRDGRFSLENQLLVFADENGEDGSIYCAELAIWDKALSTHEAFELGGFSHSNPKILTQNPFIQSPGKTFMTICWHDTVQQNTKVIYGIDSTNMSLETTGSSEFIISPLYWHTVKLYSLMPGTRYFYKVFSGDVFSDTYSFKTLPSNDYNGKLRFILLSDTHSSDTTMAGKICRQARKTITELYGVEIENQVTGIIHSGDVVMSGDSPVQYYKQFFQPLSALTANIPTTVVAGNHEVESSYFYQYLKVDELSAYPHIPDLNEKLLQLQVGNTLFLGLNTNITAEYGLTQANWLNAKLKEAENNDSIDFVFLFHHHPPMSELWDYTNTKDAGTAYVRDVLFPIIKKYSKVQQMHYGHTHGFERGTIQAEHPDGDFRIICGGGSGGYLDTWAPGENHDFNEITTSISNYVFQIIEIDIANKSWQNKAYSLGTLDLPKNGVIIDSWYKKMNQPAPNTPFIVSIETANEYVQINTSQFDGIDSLMSVQIQVIDGTQNNAVVFDSLIQKVNIYGVDSSQKPTDLNKDNNIYETNLPIRFFNTKSNYIKTRYRDNNLKWSNWSDSFYYSITGLSDISKTETEDLLFQNFPNPFSYSTTIKYKSDGLNKITFRFYDINYRLIFEQNEGLKPKGIYILNYSGEDLKNGIYFYEMISGSQTSVKSMIKIK
jgi:predicted phosphodiesterase